jgi:hypothetical protein
MPAHVYPGAGGITTHASAGSAPLLIRHTIVGSRVQLVHALPGAASKDVVQRAANRRDPGPQWQQHHHGEPVADQVAPQAWAGAGSGGQGSGWFREWGWGGVGRGSRGGQGFTCSLTRTPGLRQGTH